MSKARDLSQVVNPIGAEKVGYQLAGGVVRDVAGKLGEFVSVKDFGAVGDGVTDDTDAIQAAIDAVRAVNGGTVYFPVGTYLVSSTIDLHQGSAINLVIQGAGRGATTITTTADIVVFQHAEALVFCDFSIIQNGTVKTGRAFSTSTDKQAAYCVYERIVVNNFKYGIWWRYSLWNSVRNVQFNSCGVGVKASRNAFPDDQTNPSAPGAWNVEPGFFHNQNSFENVLCNGGEAGIWGTFNGAVFNNVTCQLQTSSTGASNVALPVGMQGTGLWLQGSDDAVGDRFGSQGNLISNYYGEFTRQPLVLDRCQVRLDSFYIQGGPSSNKYPQGLLIRYNSIIDGQGCAASGSDWFDNRIVASDSIIRGPIGAGAVYGNISSLTNSTWTQANGSGVGLNVYFSLNTTGQTKTLYTCPKRIGAVMVHCTVIRDGSDVRYGTWTVYFYQSGVSAVIADPGNLISATITVSGSDIVYTMSESLSHGVTAHVLPLALLGQVRDNGIYEVL